MKSERLANFRGIALTLAILFTLGLRAAPIPVQVTAPADPPPPSELSGIGLHIMPANSPHPDLFAFASYASLVAEDTNQFSDIYLWSRLTGKVQLITKGTNGPANGASYDPALSKNGRYIAFLSTASNFLPDTNRVEDVYLADLQTGALELVTVPFRTTTSFRFTSTRSPTISEDGRYVAYVSRRSDLATGTIPMSYEYLIIRDRLEQKAFYAPAKFDSFVGSLRPHKLIGNAIWYSQLTNLYSLNLINLTLTTNGTSSTDPAFSPSGNWIALQTASSRTNILRRLNAATREVQTLLATSNNVVRFSSLSISDNGRIAFFSGAPLSPEDLNTNVDLYVTPPAGVQGSFIFASNLPKPAGASQTFSGPVLSANGARVSFRVNTSIGLSRTSQEVIRELSSPTPALLDGAGASQNMSRRLGNSAGVFTLAESNHYSFQNPSSINEVAFLRIPDPPEDSDGDGLPDWWEGAAFGSLDQTADGDPDNDGMSNLAEFLVGTNPNQSGSAFRLEMVSVGNVRHLIYPSTEHSVSVQYREQVDAGDWINLSEPSTEPDGRSSFLDSDSVAQRFYRLRLIP